MKSYLGNKTLPRGIRNNNPGNLVITSIKWKGKLPKEQNTDGKFEQFESLNFGLRALALDIANDIKKNKLDTIQKLITAYAPPKENDTDAYISAVSKATGHAPGEKISAEFKTIAALIKVITNVENGKKAAELITDEDIKNSLTTLAPSTIKTATFIILPIIGIGFLFYLWQR